MYRTSDTGQRVERFIAERLVAACARFLQAVSIRAEGGLGGPFLSFLRAGKHAS